MKTTLVAALSIAAILLACSVAGADGAHTIALRSDATIVLPAQVTYLQEFEPLPPNLLKASLYRLPGGAIFSLNVAKPEDVDSCTAETDRDWKQFQDAQKVPGMSKVCFRLAKADRPARRQASRHLLRGRHAHGRRGARRQAIPPGADL